MNEKIIPFPGPKKQESDFQFYLNRAKELLESNMFLESLEYFELAFLIKPKNVEVLENLGGLYFNLEDYIKAEEVYGRLLREDSKSEIYHYFYALSSALNHKSKQAKDHFLLCLKLNPDFDAAKYELGVLYYTGGNIFEALKFLKTVKSGHYVAMAKGIIRKAKDEILSKNEKI